MPKHLPWLPCFLGLNMLLSNPVYATSPTPDDVIGTWATQGYGALVLISPCSNTPEELCGQITWLWTDRDAEGNLLTDKQNPNDDLQERPLVGTTIFRGFAPQSSGRWRGSGIYNPEDGNTYAASLSPRPDGTLAVTGCVLGIFCQTQIWRRPQTVCPVPAIIAHTHQE